MCVMTGCPNCHNHEVVLTVDSKTYKRFKCDECGYKAIQPDSDKIPNHHGKPMTRDVSFEYQRIYKCPTCKRVVAVNYSVESSPEK